jgi:adenine-specific DNA-methyltransferase
MLPVNQAKKCRLELTWIGKENRLRLEPRILLEDPSESDRAGQQVQLSDQGGTH